jgi:hypothetical protein
MNVAPLQDAARRWGEHDATLNLGRQQHRAGGRARRMGTTCVKLPFGGCANSDPDEVRIPRLQWLALAIGSCAALAGFLAWML